MCINAMVQALYVYYCHFVYTVVLQVLYIVLYTNCYSFVCNIVPETLYMYFCHFVCSNIIVEALYTILLSCLCVIFWW